MKTKSSIVIKILLYVFLLYTFSVLQTSAAESLAVGGAAPNFMIVFTICCAFIGGTFGIVSATINGFVMDMVSYGTSNGFYMISSIVIVGLICIFRENSENEWRYLPLPICVFATSLIMVFCKYVMISGETINLISTVGEAVFPEALYNTLLSLPYTAIVTIVIVLKERKKERDSMFY